MTAKRQKVSNFKVKVELGTVSTSDNQYTGETEEVFKPLVTKHAKLMTKSFNQALTAVSTEQTKLTSFMVRRISDSYTHLKYRGVEYEIKGISDYVDQSLQPMSLIQCKEVGKYVR